MTTLLMNTEAVTQLSARLRQTARMLIDSSASLQQNVTYMPWESSTRDHYVSEVHQAMQRLRADAERLNALADVTQKEVSQWIETDAHFSNISFTDNVSNIENPQIAIDGEDKIGNNIKLIGNPEKLSQYAQKQVGNSCNLYAQGMAMEALTGQKTNLEDAKKITANSGYFNIKILDGSIGMGQLWEQYGIEYNRFEKNSILISDNDIQQAQNFLINNIKANKAVITGVDASTLYKEYTQVKLAFPYNILDGHAVWVTGLEMDNNQNITKVIMNDSALGYSIGISFENFMKAWQEKSFLAIASKDSMRE